jgi:putative ABC transport system permease protein
VADAAVNSGGLFGAAIAGTTFREGEQINPNDRGTLVNYDNVTPGYFNTMRIPLLHGREFTEFDREGSTKVAIINEVMARMMWPGQEALGKRFYTFADAQPYEVIGVVGNTVVLQISQDPQPTAYVPLRQQYSAVGALIVRTTGNPEAVLETARRQVQQLDRNLAFTNANTVGQVLDQGLWAPRMGAVLLGVFGLLALALASIGIYGVMAYSVSQRTNEIGIRMALGARPEQVLRQVLAQGMQLALMGAVAGVLIALALGRFVSGLLFGVSGKDPLTFGAVALLLSGVAALACYFPARRATCVDPIVALRYE